MKPVVRTWLGFLFAPLAPQFVILQGAMKYGPDKTWALIVMFLSYLLALLAIVPTHFILKRRGKVSLRNYWNNGAIAGALVGFTLTIPFAIHVGLKNGRSFADQIMFLFLMAILMGGVAMFISATFWLIARPDQRR